MRFCSKCGVASDTVVDREEPFNENASHWTGSHSSSTNQQDSKSEGTHLNGFYQRGLWSCHQDMLNEGGKPLPANHVSINEILQYFDEDTHILKGNASLFDQTDYAFMDLQAYQKELQLLKRLNIQFPDFEARLPEGFAALTEMEKWRPFLRVDPLALLLYKHSAVSEGIEQWDETYFTPERNTTLLQDRRLSLMQYYCAAFCEKPLQSTGFEKRYGNALKADVEVETQDTRQKGNRNDRKEGMEVIEATHSNGASPIAEAYEDDAATSPLEDKKRQKLQCLTEGRRSPQRLSPMRRVRPLVNRLLRQSSDDPSAFFDGPEAARLSWLYEEKETKFPLSSHTFSYNPPTTSYGNSATTSEHLVAKHLAKTPESEMPCAASSLNETPMKWLDPTHAHSNEIPESGDRHPPNYYSVAKTPKITETTERHTLLPSTTFSTPTLLMESFDLPSVSQQTPPTTRSRQPSNAPSSHSPPLFGNRFTETQEEIHLWNERGILTKGHSQMSPTSSLASFVAPRPAGLRQSKLVSVDGSTRIPLFEETPLSHSQPEEKKLTEKVSTVDSAKENDGTQIEKLRNAKRSVDTASPFSYSLKHSKQKEPSDGIAVKEAQQAHQEGSYNEAFNPLESFAWTDSCPSNDTTKHPTVWKVPEGDAIHAHSRASCGYSKECSHALTSFNARGTNTADFAATTEGEALALSQKRICTQILQNPPKPKNNWNKERRKKQFILDGWVQVHKGPADE